MDIKLEISEQDLQTMREYSERIFPWVENGKELQVLVQTLILQTYSAFLPHLRNYSEILTLTREELLTLRREHGDFSSFTELLRKRLWDVVRDLEIV